MTIRLNADAGESYGPWSMGRDAELMPHIHLVNLACGFHAADPHTIRRSVALAKQLEVQIGAHPGYADKEGFGRRSIPHTPEEIYNLTLYQLGALDAFCRAADWPLRYVKPHGALYHDMMQRPEVFAALVAAVADFNPELALVLLAVPEREALIAQANQRGLTLWWEAFADRAYLANGQLAPRGQAGAVHTDPAQMMEQVRRIMQGEPLTTLDGGEVCLQADLICVHGDHSESIALVGQLRQMIEAA